MKINQYSNKNLKVRGFSFMELLIAMSIISVGISAALKMSMVIHDIEHSISVRSESAAYLVNAAILYQLGLTHSEAITFLPQKITFDDLPSGGSPAFTKENLSHHVISYLDITEKSNGLLSDSDFKTFERYTEAKYNDPTELDPALKEKTVYISTNYINELVDSWGALITYYIPFSPKLTSGPAKFSKNLEAVRKKYISVPHVIAEFDKMMNSAPNDSTIFQESIFVYRVKRDWHQ